MSRPDPASRAPDDAYAERGRALLAGVVAPVRAPQALRERVEATYAPRRERRRRRRRIAALAPAAGALAAVVVALVLALGGGAPSVRDAGRLADRGAAAPAPAADPAQPEQLREQLGGIPFPTWTDVGWRASGARYDELDGRDATTVFYRRGEIEAAYTIVGGELLPIPDDSRVRWVDGIKFWVLEAGARRLAVWERNGHTCIVSAQTTLDEHRLLELAVS